MSDRAHKSRCQLTVESLEDRLNPSPVLLQNLTIPGANSVWDYSRGPFNAAPLVTDLNGDGRDDVVVPGGDGQLYAFEFNPNSGQMNTTPRKFDLGGNAAQIQCTPVLVLLPNGIRGLFVGTTKGLVFGWNAATGALLPGWPQTVSTPLSQTAEDISIYGAMATADLDHDGSPEILCTSFNHELTAFRANGSVMWRFNDDDTVFTGIAVGDLNNDGNLEVIAGGDSTASQFYWDGGRVNCLSSDGRREWVKRTDQVIWSSPTLADLDGDGKLEVIIGTGYFIPTTGLPPFPGNLVYALDATGKDVPGWPYVTAASTTDARPFSSPAIADLNGDGTLEVVIGDGAGQLHAIRSNGTALWKIQAFAKQNLYTSPIIADFTGNNKPSVLIAAAGNIRAFDGATGGPTGFGPQDNQFHFSAAAIGHIRGNGSFQMAIIGNASAAVTGAVLSPSFLQIFDMDATTLNPPWAQFRQDPTNNATARPFSSVTPLINQLYANVRNRAPSAGELTFQQAVFSRAGSLRDAILSVFVNPETRGVVVDGLYQSFLNRTPDPGGRTVWVDFLGSNRTYAQATVEFAASNEAFIRAGNTNPSFVTLLYRKILKRTADPSPQEVQGWVDFLNRGVTRTALAGFFALSTEATNRQVATFYATYQPGGQATAPVDALAAAGADLRAARQEEQVLADILTSGGDYTRTTLNGSFVRAAYQDMLQRAPSANETSFWLDGFERGTQTQLSFATALTRSSEYQFILVRSYFKVYLNRQTPASDGEASPFVNMLLSGAKREDVIKIFVTSQEYFNLAGSNVGFINKVFTDLLGHLPNADQLSFWLGQTNLRTALPQSALFGAPQEFYQNTISQWFYRLYRRLPSTPVDSSRLIPPGTPFAEQGLVGQWATGTLPGDIQASLLIRSEYLGIALRKSFWLGDRWLDVPLI